MLQIDLSAREDGLHEENLRLSPEDLELDPAIFSDIATTVRLDLSNGRVFASYDISAVATLECDRTSVEFKQPVEGSHSVLFLPPDQIPSDSDEENVLPLGAGETEIDLTSSARDTLMLSLPVRRVAPQAEGKEIDTVFGATLDKDGVPIDDRWDALRSLQSDDK